MAFILEEISDADRDAYGLTKPEGEIQISRWVIDRERNIFLVHRGGGGAEYSEINFYELNWDRKKIIITAESTRHKTEEKINDHTNIYDITFTIKKIEAPEILGVPNDKITNAAEAALQQYGVWGNKEKTGNVVVTLPEHIDHYQDKHSLSFRGISCH